MSQTTCPVLTPSVEEFEDFQKYIDSIDELLEENGVVKVIAPAGWCTPDYNWREWNMQIESPILQLASGKAGVYHVDIVESKPISLADFETLANEQKCSEEDNFELIERKFWKSLGIASVGEPPMYGADMVGSIFGDKCSSSWNLSKLDTILKLLGDDLPGITTPMLYVGMWRSMFAFHVEDMDLYSINYVHFGAAKSWYSVPEEYAERFESLANSYFPELFNECREYLRHKMVMISPSKLREHGIPFKTVVQQPGEFVITSPKAYHAGFNHGFNFAEATNFATDRWIGFGRNARVCKCRPFCVNIDMDYFETKYRRLRRAQQAAAASRVTPTEEQKEEDRPWQHDPGWEFQCTCGVRCTDEDHPSKHPIGEQFECSKCGIWCHVKCAYDDDATLESIPAQAICPLCMNIDALEDTEQPNVKITSRLERRRRDEEGTSTCGSRINRETASLAMMGGRKRPRRSTKASYQVGSEVYVYFFDGSRESGVVEKLEDDAAKIHFHRRRKDRDRNQWMPLHSNALYLRSEVDVNDDETAATDPGINAPDTVQDSSVSQSTTPNKRVKRTSSGKKRRFANKSTATEPFLSMSRPVSNLLSTPRSIDNSTLLANVMREMAKQYGSALNTLPNVQKTEDLGIGISTTAQQQYKGLLNQLLDSMVKDQLELQQRYRSPHSLSSARHAVETDEQTLR